MSISREFLYHALEAHFPKGLDGIVLDADKTITPAEFDSWPYFTRRLAERFNLGVTPEQALKIHEDIFNEYFKTRATEGGAFQKMLDGLIALWTNNGLVKIRRSDIEEIVREIPIRKKVKEFIKEAKTHGVKVGVVTASFDIFACYLDEELDLDFSAYNSTLQFDEEGFLSGMNQNPEYELYKWIQIKELAEKFGISLIKLLVFGDGYSDLVVFKNLKNHYLEYSNEQTDEDSVQYFSNRGITVGKDPELAKLSFAVVDEFDVVNDAFARYASQHLLRNRLEN